MIALYRPSCNRSFPKGTTRSKARSCSSCGLRIPRGYSRLFCGTCERLRALRVANKTIRLISEEWAKVHATPKWSDKWDSKYSCEERDCARCGKRFTQKQWWQSFCSAECEVPPNLLGQELTIALCEVCNEDKIPLFEGTCLDCLSDEQRAEFEAIMSQYKIVKPRKAAQQ